MSPIAPIATMLRGTRGQENGDTILSNCSEIEKIHSVAIKHFCTERKMHFKSLLYTQQQKYHTRKFTNSHAAYTIKDEISFI